MNGWAEHPNVTAIIYAGAPGEQTGPAIVDVMYGAYNPSGRLPFSLAKVRLWDHYHVIIANSQRILG